jgi:hypothetical protein
MKKNVSICRHLVLFQYAPETSGETVAAIGVAFEELCARLPLVIGFERGVNSSPEGLNQGFTHAFLVTFATEADRDLYLPHPEHQEFVARWVSPHLAQVCVVDYLTTES